jgi:serine/threonine protein kinase
MGEVYLARDPRLGRDVAIKVLLPSFAADENRLKRFQQEARSVALLNHPNVLQIYDTGLFEGTPYLVMELLGGQTLRDRMEGRPMSVRRATDIAIQIARGLAVAHDKGIIHRDLKPENIFVGPDGQVKILDFGLAKLLGPLSGDGNTTREQDALSMLTRVGSVVGTAGYMSPEQVNGHDIDCRSDLFSLGIILWEMIHGTRPFQGQSMVETMHAILKDDPPESADRVRLPQAILRILRRCLEKDPKARFQTAQDLAFNLENASLSGSTATLILPQRRPGRAKTAWLKPVLLCLGLLALLSGAWWAGKQTGGQEPVTFHRLTYRNGLIRSARLAPDGQTYVYGMAQGDQPAELMAGRIDGIGARSLSLPPNTEILSISSQGEMALLLKNGSELQGTLAVAPLAGGAPRAIQENVISADWGPDGKDLAIIRHNASGNQCLDYPIGHRLLDADGATTLDRPRVSPRGDLVAFLEDKGMGKGSLAIVDLQGRKRVLVKGTCGSLQWGAGGKLIYFTFRHSDDRQDVRSVSLSGRQRVLDTVMGRVRIHDVSRSGRLLLEHTIWKTSMFLQAPGQTLERDISWLQSSIVADLSADGRHVLFGESREGLGPGGAYLRSLDHPEAVRLGDGDPLALSPDGNWALVSPMDSPRELTLLPTGPGSPRTFKGVRADWGVFLPGGRTLLVGGVDPAGEFKNFLLDLRSGDLKPWGARGRSEAYCVLSPEGSRVALGPVDGALNLHTLDGKLLATVPGLKDGEWVCQWTADGTAVYVVDPTQMPAKAYLFNVTTGARTLWREIAPPDRTGVERIKTFTVTPDGRSYAFSFIRTLTSDLYVTDPL